MKDIKSFNMNSEVKKLLVPRFDTIGDIIILHGFLRVLLDSFQHSEITIIVRDGYVEELAPLFSFPRLNWKTVPFNPYAPVTDSNEREVVSFLNDLASEPWDIALFTTYNRTFLEELIAASLHGVRRVAMNRIAKIVPSQVGVMNRLGLDESKIYDQLVQIEESEHEIKKYASFIQALLPQYTSVDLIPRIEVPYIELHHAEEILSSLNLFPEKYFVCMPAGLQNVYIKRWPPDRFAELAEWSANELGLKTLLVGHISEKAYVDETAYLMSKCGLTPHVWLGRSGEIKVLSALLKLACFYVGNDSAPMHLSAAVGTPTIGIFGGGHWPRFLPSGDKALGVACPLPCFYCEWDCIFENAPCIRFVTVNDIENAIQMVLNNNVGYKENQLIVGAELDGKGREFLQQSCGRIKSYREEICKRQEVIDYLRSSLDADKKSYEHELEQIHSMFKSSLSWRLTRPLRWVISKIYGH